MDHLEQPGHNIPKVNLNVKLATQVRGEILSCAVNCPLEGVLHTTEPFHKLRPNSCNRRKSEPKKHND